MRLKRRTVGVVIVVLLVMLAFPALALAAGNDVGANVSKLMRHYAAELYTGVVAIFGLGFLVNRRYRELATFLLAAVVVAWLVFSPDQVAHTARSLGDQIL
jgi:peptidoglycan/LPS O-acetylase OafA/YrhL